VRSELFCLRERGVKMNGLRNRTPVTTQNGPLNPIKEWPAVPGDSVPANVNWRKWAKRIQQETDPQKVFTLARQLFAEFDNEKLPGGLPSKQDSIVPRRWSPYPLGPIRGMVACYFRLESRLLQYDPR
jgi:hypothetical protein